MSIGREGGRSPLLILSLLVAVALAAAWFLGPIFHAERTPAGPTPTAAPTAFFTMPIDSAPRSAVLSYARSLDYDTAHAVGDYRRLAVGCPRCTYGPHVFLRPERGAVGLDTMQLAAGRIVARLVNVDSDSYPKLNLAGHDTTYWWMDKRGPGGGWRSYYVSSNPRRPLKLDTLSAVHHYPYGSSYGYWGRTFARFLWLDGDEALRVACDRNGCCTSSGADIY
jgi:hypothetical protein